MVGLSDAEKMQPGVLPLMAECYGMLRRPGDAGEAYARASDVDSGNLEYATQAAAWLEKADRKDAAKRYADRAKRLADAAEADK